MDENKEELSFVPSAVSDSAGGLSPGSCATGSAGKQASSSTTSQRTENPHTINLCKTATTRGKRKEKN